MTVEHPLADVPIATLLTRLSGEIRFANRRAGALLGCTPDALVGRFLGDFLAPDERTAETERRDALTAGRPELGSSEVHLRHAEGDAVCVRRSSAITHSDDEPLIIEMFDDVGVATQHALGERVKELNLLHALARRLLRSGGDRLQELLQDVADWLPPAMQYPAHASARVRIGSLEARSGTFAADRATLRSEWREADSSMGAVEVQYREDPPIHDDDPLQDGPFLAEERVLLDSVADLLRAASLGMREAAEQRQAEQALRLQEAQLRGILDAARIGTIDWELRGGYVLMSDVARQILAFPPGTNTISDLELRQRIHPEHRETVRERFARDASTAAPSAHEFPLLLPDGSSRWVTVRSRVTCDAHGVPSHRTGVIFESVGATAPASP